MLCKKCGNEIKDGMKFCGNCGAASDDSAEIKETISLDSYNNNVTGHKYRFRCCYAGGHGRIPVVVLPLLYAITYFTGDSIDFTFQESTIKIVSSNLDIEEPYESINNIYFQDNVPFKRNFPFTVSLIISFLIVAIISNNFESDFISIISIILTLGVSVLLKFGKKKRTAIIIEYKDGKKIFIPMKKVKSDKLALKEQFLEDVKSIFN